MENGSSSSSSSGRGASARASATRCCCPPEISCGYLSSDGGEADQLRQLRARALRARGARRVQPEGDVAGDREVREQRVVLEHHADAPLLRRHHRAGAGNRPCRRGGSRLRGCPRSRRCSAAPWSCRSRSGRAGSRWRRARARSSGRARPPGRRRRGAGFRPRAACSIIVIDSHSYDRNEALNSKDLRSARGRGGRWSRRAARAAGGLRWWRSFLGGASDLWAHLAATALPRYVGNTALLLVAVACGVVSIGVVAAWLVTAYRFPGRGVLEWALLLPLAMPAYVMAYAYTDWLQFAGPVQSALRAADRLAGARVLVSRGPLARRRGGDAFVRALSLRLPHRAHRVPRSLAQRDRGRAARRATARWGAFLRVAVPLARPAIAAGAALALMETLADFGTVSYFGVEVFTTGIFKAWFSMGDSVAAAQLSTCLLGFVRGAARARAREPRPRRVPRHRAAQAARAAPPARRRARAPRSPPAPRRWSSASCCRRCCSASSPSRKAIACGARSVALVGEQLRHRRAHGADRRRASRW